MGHLACNAVANATSDFAKEKRKIISQPPFSGHPGGMLRTPIRPISARLPHGGMPLALDILDLRPDFKTLRAPEGGPRNPFAAMVEIPSETPNSCAKPFGTI
jgi:hypothetical protein